MGPIEPDKKPEEVRQTPYALPNGYEWTEVDVTDDAELKELYELLTFNYVEDDDAMFRFDYSAPFLRWCAGNPARPHASSGPAEPRRRALQPPGWIKAWHPGVRVSASKKLVGFISAIPVDIRVHTQSVRRRGRAAPPADGCRQPPGHGGGQLPVCAQEAAHEAARARPDQGGHPARAPARHLPGGAQRARPGT